MEGSWEVVFLVLHFLSFIVSFGHIRAMRVVLFFLGDTVVPGFNEAMGLVLVLFLSFAFLSVGSTRADGESGSVVKFSTAL